MKSILIFRAGQIHCFLLAIAYNKNMITLNDYLYSGDTVLCILQKYKGDLLECARKEENEVDYVHCDFLTQIMDLLEHNDFLTAQSQKIREFYKYMASTYPYLSFTFKGRIKSLIRAEEKFNGYIVEYIYDYYMEHQAYPPVEELKERAIDNSLINDGCGLYRGRWILPYEHLSRFQNDLID